MNAEELAKETEASGKYDIGVLKPSDLLDEWDNFVGDSPQGSIFCRSWWLRSVCSDCFKVLTLKSNGKIVAGMPLPLTHDLRGTRISMPPLTQCLGMLLSTSQGKTYERRFAYELQLIKALTINIPHFDFYSVCFHYNFTNWLPLYWSGYKQTTRYTYVLPDLTNLEDVFANFAHSKRKNIRKAEKIVDVREDLPAEDFYNNHLLTLKKQGLNISYSFKLFSTLYHAAYQHNSGKTWYAVDRDNNIHAAIFVVYDQKSAYYLISTIDPDFRDSGAATLLLREAISHSSKHTTRFDFEGSMIENVENSFRKYSAVQTPYFHISKDLRDPIQKVSGRLYGATNRLRGYFNSDE